MFLGYTWMSPETDSVSVTLTPWHCKCDIDSVRECDTDSVTLTLWQSDAESAEMEGSQAARDLSHWRGRVWATVWTLSWVSVSHNLNTFWDECELQFEHFLGWVWATVWTFSCVSVSCNLNTLLCKCELQFEHFVGWVWAAIWTLFWVNVNHSLILNTWLLL